MITFNTLLAHEGIDPKTVRLVRHQDNRYPGRPTPYVLWRSSVTDFELYQRIQGRNRYQRADVIASFVGTPTNETLFVGLYTVKGVGKAPAGIIDPVSGEDVADLFLYDLSPSPKLGDYRGKLFIAWGEGYRAWVQRAAVKDKLVLEIRRTISDPPFPGFLNFSLRLSQLATVPPEWRTTLSSVGGIYLLTCPEKGTQYVGLAHGAGGFWGRWENYVTSGHGGNRRMREIPAADYQVSVLEVTSSSASVAELVDLESRWKRKLMTREFGLNAN